MVAPLTEAQTGFLTHHPVGGDVLLLADAEDTGPHAAIWGSETELFAHLSPATLASDMRATLGSEDGEVTPRLEIDDPDLAEIERRLRQSLLADPLPSEPNDFEVLDTPLRWADTPAETEVTEPVGPTEIAALQPDAQTLLEEKHKNKFGFMKLFGEAVRIARQAKKATASRVSDAFAMCDETSHRLSPRTTAVMAASAVLLSALGYVYSPETTGHAKTEQAAQAKPEQELALLTAHIPKIENAPSGAWVPPSIKVWEDSVNKLLHAKELEPYNLLVDPQLILAIMTPSSLGDPNAKGHNGRLGLMQIPKEEGDPQYMKGYDPLSPRDSIVVGILDIDHRMKIALAAQDYSHDRAGLIRAVIEGPEPGLGYEPVPAYAKALADRVIQLDANWSKPTNDGYNTWIADASVASLLNQAVTNLLDQGLLVRKK